MKPSSDMEKSRLMQEDIEAEIEWKNIRKTIDKEYQKKLKQVNDEAMMKL